MSWSDELATLAVERGPALVGYAYLLTGDLHRAEDLVQEALLRTFGRPGRAEADLVWAEAYVRRVVLNAYLDGYRKDRSWGRVRHLVAVRDHGDRAADTDGDGPLDPARTTADRVDVQRALATLPPRERACVVLRYFEDLTVPAVADRLGISLGTAKRYLSDALRRLEPVLGPLEPPTAQDDVAPVRLTDRRPR